MQSRTFPYGTSAVRLVTSREVSVGERAENRFPLFDRMF